MIDICRKPYGKAFIDKTGQVYLVTLYPIEVFFATGVGFLRIDSDRKQIAKHRVTRGVTYFNIMSRVTML